MLTVIDLDFTFGGSRATTMDVDAKRSVRIRDVAERRVLRAGNIARAPVK